MAESSRVEVNGTMPWCLKSGKMAHMREGKSRRFSRSKIFSSSSAGKPSRRLRLGSEATVSVAVFILTLLASLLPEAFCHLVLGVFPLRMRK